MLLVKKTIAARCFISQWHPSGGWQVSFGPAVEYADSKHTGGWRAIRWVTWQQVRRRTD